VSAPTAAPADGAYVLKLARLLLANGKARGWSHALEQARKLAGPPKSQ